MKEIKKVKNFDIIILNGVLFFFLKKIFFLDTSEEGLESYLTEGVEKRADVVFFPPFSVVKNLKC